MKSVKMLLVSVLVLLLVLPSLFAGGQKEEAEGEMQDVTVTLWTTEEQPERIAVQQQIAQRFTEQTGIAVEVVPVTENQMGERVTAAFSAGDLPDVIYHPLNFSLGWAEAGVLDTIAASEVIAELGEDTYGAGALNLVSTSAGGLGAAAGGEYAAVPVDGWTQLLVYRADLFEEHGLEPPTSYDAIRTAVETLHNPPELYGFVAATDPSQVYMMQVFEHIALANGVDIVDDEGNVTLDTPEMRETLEFYKVLAEASPPGNLFWEQSRELYFAGRAAMIVWSPFIMDELAGLRNEAPVTAFDDPATRELARRTGFITNLAGPSNPEGSGWTDMRYFGITVDADTEAAKQFVAYSMQEGYIDTLSIAAEGKFPVRFGTPDESNRFVDQWRQLEVGVDRRASLGELYSDDVIDRLFEGLETGSRWGFARGRGNLTSTLYDTRVVAELVREYIDGERTVDETLSLLQQEVAALGN